MANYPSKWNRKEIKSFL